MKFRLGLVSILFLAISSTGFALDIPESSRSVKAISEASTRLKPQLESKNMKLGQPAFIRIFKREKELELWLENEEGFALFKTWPIAEFSGHPGPKTRQGDNQAPEGFYFVPPSQMNPWSSYHLSFNLGYPNRYERRVFQRSTVHQGARISFSHDTGKYDPIRPGKMV